MVTRYTKHSDAQAYVGGTSVHDYDHCYVFCFRGTSVYAEGHIGVWFWGYAMQGLIGVMLDELRPLSVHRASSAKLQAFLSRPCRVPRRPGTPSCSGERGSCESDGRSMIEK